MDNKIRYSRIPKYAYGTKGIPKFGVGTPEEGTDSMGTTQGGGFGSKIGGSMGWFAFANQAQTGVRGMTAKKRIVNPQTGEVTEYQTTGEGQIAEEIAQPYHEKYMNDIKNHEYAGIAAQLAGGPIGQMAYNGIWGKKKKDAFNQGKEQEAKSAQDAIDAENAKNALAFENKQRDIYSRAYLAENPANGQAGASIYAYGTKEDSYGTTSINPNSKNMSPQQWHEYNIGLGYKEVPTSSTITGRHKEYYNPNEYSLDKDNNFVKKADIGKVVNYNNDKTYQPIIKYQPMPDIVTPSKPIISPTSDRTATTFGTFNGKATTAYKYKDGRTAILYNDGTPVQYAYGTSNGMSLPKKALGGQLNPLASDIEKAEGASHEQGGITLHDNNGQAKAEIEGEEVVVDNNKVLSNRLPLLGGNHLLK